jgi:signal transduction histidine kinase
MRWRPLKGKGGEITVTVSVVEAPEIWASRFFPFEWKPRAGNYACLSVSDTGRGMAESGGGRMSFPHDAG